jgi:signal peptidase I
MDPSITDNPHKPDAVRYSEDVKEAVALALKVARKAKSPVVLDVYFLDALLLQNRPFSRLDGLLRKMGVSPKRLAKSLQKAPTSPATRSEAGYSAPSSSKDTPEMPLLEVATHLAMGEAGLAAGPDTKITVEVEHLLKALALSDDPTVSQLFQEAGITETRIADIVPSVVKNTTRKILYIGRELMEILFVVFFVLIVTKEGLGELRLIPSESMLPLLQVEDRVFIEKVTRWPLPGAQRPYQRGDVLVFYPPTSTLKDDLWSVFLRKTGISGLLYKRNDGLPPNFDPNDPTTYPTEPRERDVDMAFIKRLIGLPGDTIQVRPGEGVWVNGKKLDEPYVNEIADTCTFVEPIEVCDEVTVPPGQYFMMGDNRNNSKDSRFWGFEPEDRVIGRAVFRVWPLNRFGPLPEPPYQAQPVSK